jgi:predicted nucleic acid-binding protein
MIVLDSSFLVAFHNSRDMHHAAARRLMRELVAGKWGRALLLEYVFLEVTTVLLVRRNLNVASAVASILLQAREIDFVPCSELFVDTVKTFRNQTGTEFSFADAAIIAAARRYSAPNIATFDGEFAKLKDIAVVP